MDDIQLYNLVKGKVITYLVENYSIDLNKVYSHPKEPLVEMAKLNSKDKGNSLFPSNSFDVRMWSNDHNPPHIHIKKDGCEALFEIENGRLFQVKTLGKNDKLLRYMANNINKWLDSPSCSLPKDTNREYALSVWDTIHNQ